MSDTNASATTNRFDPYALTAATLTIACLIYLFRDGLAYMVGRWGSMEEYNHGYLIPFVAGYLFWLRAKQFDDTDIRSSWWGLVLLVMGLAGFFLGELSAIYVVIEYSFILALFGLVCAAVGWRGLKIVWVPLVYLIFMVPLPNFIYANLSAELQLISSELGVAVARLFGISVFLEGNVIDLGVYQLQVAEACSGLRYLFPLMSFGFLCAAIYQGPVWHRIVLFFSTIPITIIMNSFRIGVISVLVNSYGIEQAEGFLHFFEGWIVFMACVGLLFGEMWCLNRLRGGPPLLEVFGLDIPPASDLAYAMPERVSRPALASLALIVGATLVSVGLAERKILLPDRQPLATFPTIVGPWSGADGAVDPVQLDSLKLDDYAILNYQRDDKPAPIELWIAYYDTQRKGESVHSPRSCLPSGGWQVESFTQETIQNVGPAGEPLTVNRSLVAKGNARLLVYYWFEQRGRKITNEYLVKWFIFWDALIRNRTDGALVRVTTLVADPSEVEKADAYLQDFVRTVNPTLAYYLPQDAVETRAVNAMLRNAVGGNVVAESLSERGSGTTGRFPEARL